MIHWSQRFSPLRCIGSPCVLIDYSPGSTSRDSKYNGHFANKLMPELHQILFRVSTEEKNKIEKLSANHSTRNSWFREHVRTLKTPRGRK
jgi:hypothetical protein